MTNKAEIADMLSDLNQKRGELRVRICLVKLDAEEEWKKLETKMTKLEAVARELAETATDASEGMLAAAKLLSDEIRDGFENFAKHL